MVILAINQAAVDKYGYDREQFLSLRIVDMIDPMELPRFSSMRLPFSETRQNAGAWVHRSASGERLEMEVVTTSSRRLGRESWLSVGIDVTARRIAERALARSEEQLRQSQKMEAIGTFAGGIAHDFGNLLTGMLGYCDLALMGLADGDPTRRDIAEIRALTVRGSDLTRQILSVSRKQVVQLELIDVNIVVRGIDTLLRRVIGEHITLHTRFPERVGTVRADPAQLEQVLLNLVSNARDAMPDGGTLTIATDGVSADEIGARALDASKGWTAIRVQDSGIGIPESRHTQVFEPFFTTKEKGRGTGLGLALVSSMIDEAGGVIRLESTVGVGTTVHLFLPCVDECASIIVPVQATPERLNGTETVLVAEDEESVRAILTGALERRGYRVLTAQDGESALAISRAYPGHIDLLLTDVVMPGISGRVLAERIEAVRPGLKVLFVLGYTDDAVLLRGIASDTKTFLQKPFTSLQLARHVRAVLDLTARVS